MLPKQHGCPGFKVRPYRMSRLKSYVNKFSRDWDKPLYDSNVADALKAQGFTVAESPRSIYTVEKLYEALAAYNPGEDVKLVRDAEILAGYSLAYKAFAKPKDVEYLSILPFDAQTIVKITSNPSGSPGLTNYGCSKQESQTRALERGVQILQGEKQPEPCLAFVRTQFEGKTRLVWGYPYSMTAIEGLLAYNLIQWFKGHSTPMSFAKTSMNLGTEIRVSSYHKEYCYSLDMSQYDAHLSSDLIKMAFSVLRSWYNPTEVEPVTGKTVAEIFNVVENYFITTPIVMPDQHLYIGKNHGVPSGSYFTQMIDTVANAIIAGAISYRFHLHISLNDLYILGDDIMFWSNRLYSLDDIARYANMKFGVKLHGQEKSAIYHYDEIVHFLGRDWRNGLPELSESEILKRMYYPENYRKYSKDAKKREKEVRMLILSYVSQYRNAWRIATSYFRPEMVWFKNGTSDVSYATYADHAMYGADLDPGFVSGLQRYKALYLYTESTDDTMFKRVGMYMREIYKPYPDPATQFWL